MSPDFEYPPLFPDGFCDIGENNLERLFAAPFGVGSYRRSLLCLKFREWLRAIESIGIPLEIWIDGSFVTQKPEPGDVDIVCVMERNDVQALKPEIAVRLKNLLTPSNMKLKYYCHVFPMFRGDKEDYDYWADKFGYDRNGNSKGMFRLFLGGRP